MDKFLGHSNYLIYLRKLEIFNRPIVIKGIKLVIKNHQTIKGPGPDGFTDEFYQTFNEELTQILFKIF